jgi:hypothetical protein
MWIIAENYQMMYMSKRSTVKILIPVDPKQEYRVFMYRGALMYLLLTCETLDTASELIDAIGDALTRGVIVFAVTDWLDAKIEAQAAPEPDPPTHDTEMDKKVLGIL